MVVEVFSICDAATDQGGRLNVLGAFDSVKGAMAPVMRERATVVARLRFGAEEAGQHWVALRFLDKDGKRIMPEMKAKFAVKVPTRRKSAAVNLVMHINRMKFDAFGEYEVAFFHGEEKAATLPLFVTCTQKGRPHNRMNN